MTDTTHLGLPYLAAAQAQKHVTHNEALRILDALVMLAVEDRDLSTPPASPVEGDRYLVKSPGSGGFAGMDNRVAHFADGVWDFYAPRPGWLCFVRDEGTLLAWNGTAWTAAIDVLGGGLALQNLSLLGIGTTADVTNPVAAKLNNALWAARTVAEGGDGSLRYKMSKENAAATLSLLMQDNFSGRAEIGLTGDDDFHFKVSPDGSTWHEGIVIDKDTGAVSFPNTSILGGRELLAANRTYYVRTDGSDSNNGLTNTSGGAFLTIQKAIDVAAALDLGIYAVTIQVAAGTYTAANTLKSYVGAGPIIIVGDETTPANVTVATTLANGFNADGVRGIWEIRGFKFTTTTAGAAFNIVAANIKFRNCEFGTMAGGSSHMICRMNGSIASTGNYTISGGAGSHVDLQQGGIFLFGGGLTVTLTGTPAFSAAYVTAKQTSLIQVSGVTFSGSATGPRYSITANSVVDSGGAGASYLPGDAAGATGTGGQYA